VHALTGEKVAVKVLEKDRICDVPDVERVSREIHILKLIRHPNIIQLYEIIETSKQIYLIMEYASGGELFDYIVKHSRLKEREACRLFQQIIAGVEYSHKLGIVHRDLKPENLLFDYNRHIKIVDFGLSNTYKTGATLKTACGSPCYAAPEMIAGKRYLGLGVDLWSCGVILFAMICGYLPFEDPNTSLLYKKILNCEYSTPKSISVDAKDLLKRILHTDPDQRYTIAQIKAHPWYRQVSQELSPGILVGYNQIPIDLNILGKLQDFSFSSEHSRRCLEGNKHNHETATYYLMLKKYLQNGGSSVADVTAEGFVPIMLAPRPPSRPSDKAGTEMSFGRYRRYNDARNR
jgi:5'-AMP-activated protein kinase catalytic alpha subunit